MPNIATPAAGYSPQVPTWKQQNEAHFHNGAARYTVYVNMDVASSRLEVSRSDDAGATWTPVGGPGPALCHMVDGVGIDFVRETLCPVQTGNVLHIFYGEATNGFVAHVTFTLGPDAWGAPNASTILYYGWYLNPGFTDGNNYYELLHAAGKPGGTYLVFFHGEEEVIGGVSIAPNIWFTEFNPVGGTWSAPVRLNDQNGGAVAEGNSRPYAVSDGTLVHVFWRKVDVAGGGGNMLAHRSIDAAGILGTEQLITPCHGNVTLAIGRPISFTYSGTIYVACPYNLNPAGSNRIFVVWSAAGANPVWTVEQAQTAGIAGQSNLPWPCACLYKDGCLYCFWRTSLLAGGSLFYGSVKWLCDLAVPWRNQTLLFSDATPLRRVFEAIPELTPASDAVDWVYSGDGSAGGTGFVAGENALPLAPFACPCGGPVPPVPPAQQQPGGTRRMVVLIPNEWDYCLLDQIRKWLYVPQKSKCCIPDPYDYFKWAQLPQGAIPFRKIASVPTPAPLAGDVIVLDFTVPLGYDGVIRGNAHHYTGPNFGDGSGDILWRILVGNTYAQFLGNVTVQMGSVDQTHPIRDGIQLVSRQRVRYIVNVPNLSGGILIGDSRIVCALEGWFVPRR